jgi:hypothetical protein
MYSAADSAAFQRTLAAEVAKTDAAKRKEEQQNIENKTRTPTVYNVPKLDVPKTNVGSLNSDTSNVLGKEPVSETSGINKDKSYKEGTYYYYLKQLGQTPEAARQSVKDAKGLALTPKTTTPLSETDKFTQENIAAKFEETQKKLAEDAKKVKEENYTIDKQSALDKMTNEMGIFSEQSNRISNERDQSIKELEDMMTGYESGRLSQVR